ncbi:MAG: hypothetical protein LWY06_18875 [Firmicutes bacterium]|nr:hypothetical protein [Bacillota bacterium]
MIERLESINSGERWQTLQTYRSATQYKTAVATGSIQTNEASPDGNVQRETAVMRKDETTGSKSVEDVKKSQIGPKECKTCSRRQSSEEVQQPKGLEMLYQQSVSFGEFCPECGRLIAGSGQLHVDTGSAGSDGSSTKPTVDLSV